MMEIDNIIQIISTALIFVGLLLTIFQISKSNKLRKLEFYTNLELASNELFKMEIDHPFLIKLYDENYTIESISDEISFQLEEYTASILNLFEIQYRLRKKNEIDPIIFASWIQWFFDALHGNLFRHYWSQIKMNYDPNFRNFLDSLVYVINDKNILEKEKLFFLKAAELMNCKVIATWRY